MALVDTTLASALNTLSNNALSLAQAGTPMSSADYNSALATAISTFIKTATVTVPVGVPVATAGSPTAQTGATTGPGIGVVS